LFQSFIHRRHLSLFLSCYEDTKQQVPLSTLFPEFSEYFDKKVRFRPDDGLLFFLDENLSRT